MKREMNQAASSMQRRTYDLPEHEETSAMRGAPMVGAA